MRVPIYLVLFCAVTSCDSSLPTREQLAGNCVKESDCSASGQACKANQCTPCTAHADCQGLVCDTYGDLGGAGKCISPDNIIYVDSSDNNVASCFQHLSEPTGSQALPLCDIPGALAKLGTAPGKIIRVFASPEAYAVPLLDTTTGPVVLIGPGGFGAGKTASLINRSTSTNPPRQIETGASVLIDGFFMLWEGLITGANSHVTIRRSQVNYLSQGASFGDGAIVTLDRDTFFMGTLGLSFSTSTVSITNTFFTGNTISPNGLLSFSGGSGIFQFNTVAFNGPGGTMSAPLVSCASAAQVIFKNSIFVQNNAARQLAQGCRTVPSSLIVGKADSTVDQVQQEPVFVDSMNYNLQLQPQDATNTQFVINKAVSVNPATENYVDHDYYGTARPSGGGYDIGAFEVKSP